MNTNKLHHANLILGKDDSIESVNKIIEGGLGMKIEANPDLLLMNGVAMSIAEARSLEKWAYNTPLVGSVKSAILVFESINWEAQNTLLKVLEEPPIGTYFFIILPNTSGLLGTFLSRLIIIDTTHAKQKELVQKDANEFLVGNIGKRMDIVRKLSKKDDKTDMKLLIADLERIAYNSKVDSSSLRNILKAKVFANVRGGSPKMLLEWLSIVV